jgi:hypothetical protein
MTTVKSKETGHPLFPLQTGNIKVQVHPIDSFHSRGESSASTSATLRVASFRLRSNSESSRSIAASAAYVIGKNCLQFSTVDRSHLSGYARSSHTAQYNSWV